MTPTPVTTALQNLQNELSGETPPQTNLELAEQFDILLGQALESPPTTRVYVPDAYSPVTVDEKDQQISGPMTNFNTEARSISLRCKNAIASLLSFTQQLTTLQTSLQQKLQTASTAVASSQVLVTSSQLGWTSQTNQLQDFSSFDPSLSNGIVLDTVTYNGVGLAPTSQTDLTGSIQSITLIQNLSQGGLPGDNLELSSIQATPGTNSPAAGATSALATAQTQFQQSGGTGQEPSVTFAGQPDLQNDLSALTNSSTQSWFDYERVYVPPVQPCVQAGTAYVADPNSGQNVNVETVTQGYGWSAAVQFPDGTSQTLPLVTFSDEAPVPGQDGASSVLNLALEINMGTQVPLTQLQVLIRQESGIWANITSISVSSDHNEWLPLQTQSGATSWQGAASATTYNQKSVMQSGASAAANGNGVLGGSTWIVPSVPNNPTFQYIDIKFAQPDSYVCPKGIGHPYYVKVQNTTTKTSALFGIISSHSSNTSTTRYATPDQVVSLVAGSSTSTSTSNLGVIGNLLTNAAGVAAGYLTKNTAIAAAAPALISGLIGSKTVTNTILQAGEYSDVFAASRQVISVGRILPLACTYNVGTPGQFVSLPIQFSTPFTALRLIVDDAEPTNTTVVYDISTDNGQTWQTIVPFDLGQAPAPSLTQPGFNVLTFSSAQQSCRVRATLTTQQSSISPRLLGYTVEVLPA